MHNKKLKALSLGLAVVTGNVLGTVVLDSVETNAMASIGRGMSSVLRNTSSSARRVSSTMSSSNVRRPQTPISTISTRTQLFSRGDRVLAGLGLAITGVAVTGTAIGLALTENQYQQSKRTFDDVVNRVYNSFYEDREKQLKDLYDKWGVPFPDKYKNPYKKEENTTSIPNSPGFSFGEGK